MKHFFCLFILFIITHFSSVAQCDYTVNMQDSWGDGWNGASIDVSINGIPSTNITILTGASGSQSFSTYTSDTVTFTFNSGSYDGEITFDIIDPSGANIGSFGPSPTIGLFLTDTSNSTCPAPSCTTPNTLSATSITDISADLGWIESGTASSWNLEYGPLGFTPGTGTTVITGSNPYNATGLTGLTSYDFYVSAICAPGDTSPIAGPFSFSTLLASLTCTSGSPEMIFSEDFESGIPAGWIKTATLNPQWLTTSGSTVSTGTGPTGAYNGSQYLFFETSGGATGDADTITLPSMDFTNLSSSARLLFNYHMFGATMGSLDVEISTNGGTSFTNIWTRAGQVQAATGDPWIQAQADLSAYVGSNVILRYIGTRGTSYTGDACVDLVQIEACVPVDIVISEIMYNPPESGTDSLEFIEIYNNGLGDVDLSNWTFTGVTYTFPTVTLPAGSFYVVAVDSVAFNSVFGFAADGVFGGGLSNAGEDVVLKDNSGMTMDSVSYDDAAPWPSGFSAGEPDGGGASLILCDADSDNNDGANWGACPTPTGDSINGFALMASPGAANSCSVDVSVTALLNLDSTYCNVPFISGSVVITNMTSFAATNVPYMITANGFPVAYDSIALLAGNASDTIAVGPLPAITGSAVVSVFTMLNGDINTSNDTLSTMVYISNTSVVAWENLSVYCNGDSTGIMAANANNGLAPYSYLWSSNAGNATTDTVYNVAAGTYIVVVTDSIGCAGTDTITVTEPPVITLVDSLDNVLCYSGMGVAHILASGGTPGYSYLWNTNDSTWYTVGIAGTYSVTVTDGLGCTATDSATITEPSAVVVSITDNGDGTATASGSGGTPSYTYAWDASTGNQTTATATGLTNNTSYSVIVSDSNGCQGFDTITVTIVGLNDIPNLSNLNMFPNPTSGNVFVEFELVDHADVEISVINSIGQTVSNKIINDVQSRKTELPTSSLPAGVYFVKFTIDGNHLTKTLIIQK